MDIKIVGGLYKEKCIIPYWNEIFGSGLRGALSLKKLSPNIDLYTFVDKAFIENQKDIVEASYGIKIIPSLIENSISFNYFHGLSTPDIVPHPITINNVNNISVQGKFILQYGMIEGNANIDGDYVVYDPQATYNPTSFIKYSKAKHLAIVGNKSEILKLGVKGHQNQPARATKVCHLF